MLDRLGDKVRLAAERRRRLNLGDFVERLVVELGECGRRRLERDVVRDAVRVDVALGLVAGGAALDGVGLRLRRGRLAVLRATTTRVRPDRSGPAKRGTRGRTMTVE